MRPRPFELTRSRIPARMESCLVRLQHNVRFIEAEDRSPPSLGAILPRARTVRERLECAGDDAAGAAVAGAAHANRAEVQAGILDREAGIRVIAQVVRRGIEVGK